MTYRVLLVETEEGFAVGCPALSGCWSQGTTQQEALENISDAIRNVVEVARVLQVEEFAQDGLSFEEASVDVAQ